MRTNDTGQPFTPATTPMPGLDPVHAPSKRLAPVIVAAQQPGSFTLLIGERGHGRLFLATAAAHQLSASARTADPTLPKKRGIPSPTVTVLPSPPTGLSGVMSVFGEDRTNADTPQEHANLILESLAAAGSRPDCTLVVPDLDAYSPGDLQLLKLILGDAHAPRVIATTSGLTNSVESVIRGTIHSKVAVGRLDLSDADRYLSRLLGVRQIEQDTLRRWHELAQGTGFGLAALAMGSASSGTLHRSNGVAWVARVDDAVPSDFATLQTSSCSAEERSMLEVITIAEPITETTLLRSLDARVLSQLFERGFVSWRHILGQQALVVTQDLLADSLRVTMPPPRCLEIYDAVFKLLTEDLQGLNPAHMPAKLNRLVSFGVLANQDLPAEWLWTAFELSVGRMELHAALRLTLRLIAHDELSPQQRGKAQLDALGLSVLLGDTATAKAVGHTITQLLKDAAAGCPLNPTLHASLRVAHLYQKAIRYFDAQHAIDGLQSLEQEFEGTHERAFEVARTGRVFALSAVGRLKDAFDLVGVNDISSDLGVEWLRSPARGAISLNLAQRGMTEQAVDLSKRMYALSQLGQVTRRSVVDLHAFAWVVSCCLGGRSEAAFDVWTSLALAPETFASAESHHVGLLDTAQLLVSVQAGRWADAAQQSEQLLRQFQHYDSLGLTPLVAASRAYTLAVLGEREEALEYLRISESPTWGISQMLGGLTRLQQLRARQWLRESNVAAAADDLAAWAAAEQLPLIELMALHTASFERGAVSHDQLMHAQTLALAMESERGAGLVAHLKQLAINPANDAPEVRFLAELGVWIPLPPAPGLSPREREVALFAALGHTSKFIAERLGISIRTVETHLTHVFTKLGVQNREELSLWFERRPAARLGLPLSA